MRKPQSIIESEKVKELLKRLKLITDWSTVKEGDSIFYKADNSIFNVNKFSEFNKEDNIIWYKNVNDRIYDMSATGWYYYDETIADEIEDEFTPKLWWSYKQGMVHCMLYCRRIKAEIY